MANKWEKSSKELVDLFYEVMESFPGVELRKMFGYPCAFYQGNMFVGLHQSDFVVRLPQDVREKALVENQGAVFAPMAGRVMKEYLSLSREVLMNTHCLKDFVRTSFKFVQSLPPKASKKKKT